MVAVDVLYNTGARDENRELTGIAHLFEHLMFGGSVNIPHFDKELENAGGTSNAWTSNDFTNFFEVAPAVNAETLFHLESDRMLSLNFSKTNLQTQKSVVIEEFKQQCLNRPYGDIMHGLRDCLYSKQHPYSWPVIGLEPQHIANVTDENIRQWFYAHYMPNNAILAISGNLPYEKGKEYVEKWFGDIPRRQLAERHLPDPGFPLSPVEKAMHGPVPYPNIIIAFPMASYGTKEYRTADLITDILSAGRSSRLIQNLVLNGNGTIIEADASIVGAEHHGFMMLSARVAEDSDHAINFAKQALRVQLANLGTPGNVTESELKRTLNHFESSFLLSNLDILSRAQNLALAEMHGEDINNTVNLQREITTTDVSATVNDMLNRASATIVYRPN